MTDPSRFVLLHPSHAGNVGAVARAIKVMGFTDLVLVRPRNPGVLQDAEALARASGATDVLAAARVVESLPQALDGISWACATAMTPRDFGPPTQAPRDHFARLQGRGHRVAFVFGGERHGMANDDVYRCNVCLSIPTHPDYGSLNLSQAVQLIAYDWRQACGGFGVAAATIPSKAQQPLADGAALQGLLLHWQQALQDIGFLDPAVPKKLMPRLQQLLNRSAVTEAELHILHGVARAASKAAERD